MAYASHVLIFLVLVSHLAIAMATIPPLCDSTCVGPCHNSCEEEIKLSYYLHQVANGPNQNQQVIVNPGFPNSFGVLAVNDWIVRVAPEPSASIVARAKGMHLQSTQTQTDGFAWFFSFHHGVSGLQLHMRYYSDIYCTWNRFSGSTLQVMGTISAADGEWAIIGGTGKLSMARGTIKFKTVKSGPFIESYRQIDIHAFCTPPPAA